MTPTKHAGVFAGAAVMACCASGFAGTPDSNDKALQARIAELEATVAELKAETGDGWLTEQRADEIRGVVEDVLADADTRASLLQGGGTAGWDDGFFLSSADGNFRLNIDGYLQVRWALSYRDKDDIPAGSFNTDTTQYGFENPRTKLLFHGNVLNPQWMYMVQLQFGGTDVELEDGYIAYDYGNGWLVQMGQFKAPFLREELVRDRDQLAVDRSVLNEFFTAGRTQGLAFSYKGDTWRMTAAYHDGARTDNTPVIGGDYLGEAEFAVAGRAEILFMGNWDQFSDFVNWPGAERGALLGFAANYQKDAYGTPFTMEDEIFGYTVDFTYEGEGWSAYAAFMGQTFDEADGDPIGFLVQGSIWLNETTDIFARYEWADFDDLYGELNDLSIIAGGFNVYFDRHDLKWTTDVSYNLDQGVYAPDVNFAGGEDELVIRSQLQLAF